MSRRKILLKERNERAKQLLKISETRIGKVYTPTIEDNPNLRLRSCAFSHDYFMHVGQNDHMRIKDRFRFFLQGMGTALNLYGEQLPFNEVEIECGLEIDQMSIKNDWHCVGSYIALGTKRVEEDEELGVHLKKY